MTIGSALTRRDFIKVTATAGGGLVLAFYLPVVNRAFGATAPRSFEPNAWLRIAPDNTVTVMIIKSEMGQGVLTSLPMIVADELDADWATVRFEQAPVIPVYGNQSTGGSTSVRGSWTTLRQAGASARQMLVSAGAKKWKVDPAACRTESGFVIHAPSGKRLSYGDLATLAAAEPVPEKPPLKDPKDFKLIGKPLKRKDAREKVIGKAIFGMDVRLPGLLTAVVARPPAFGAKLKGAFNVDAHKHILGITGVRHIVRIDSGIAVVADNFWAAMKGADALKLEWDDSANAWFSSASLRQSLEEAARNPAAVAREQGDAPSALKSARRTIEALYEVPFLAHATMEPMNCTADVRGDACDIYAPTQTPTGTHGTAVRLTGMPADKVRVHTTLLGGGFGRRFKQDFVTDAIQISKAIHKPVKVVYSRENDIRHDFYRPATYNVLRGGLGADSMPVAWIHRIVGPSILGGGRGGRGGPDPTSTEGAANLPYAIPNILVDYVQKDTPVPLGFWRSVGNSQNAFVVESFVDEIAATAGRDPLELRRALLKDKRRHLGVLNLAAEKAGWEKPLPKGRGRGIAVHASFGSFVAQVAEVSVAPDGKVKVHRVVCAIDCGIVVNPDTVKAQMESGIVYGLSAALYGKIIINRGRVEQSNFHDYPILRFSEMPVVEVHMVPSAEALGGVGEPGVPPIAPAVCNAIFAASGKRIRRLPISTA
jgi:isoquinoline 1-oxidoreductase beta subunit